MRQIPHAYSQIRCAMKLERASLHTCNLDIIGRDDQVSACDGAVGDETVARSILRR